MSKSSKKERRPFTILHECKACGNKWDAKFEVKHCFNCGIDERTGDSLPVIFRQKVFLINVNGEWKIPLTLIKVDKNG